MHATNSGADLRRAAGTVAKTSAGLAVGRGDDMLRTGPRQVVLSLMAEPQSPNDVLDALAGADYVADIGLATVVYLALTMQKPLFLEGEAGVGKTELAKVLALVTGGELIRLQCHEGIDVSQALYEWDYSRQLLHLRTAEITNSSAEAETLENELYAERFLVRRPVLRAITSSTDVAPVLLIDEIDRADDEFEAFLLELLSDFSDHDPRGGHHRGRVNHRSSSSPRIAPENVHDALKRRCLYHWVEHPDFEHEVEIIGLKAPEAAASLTRQVAAATAKMRDLGLYKPPGVAESIDWAHALAQLGAASLDEAMIEATLGSVLKYREDQQRVLNSSMTDMLAVVGNA